MELTYTRNGDNLFPALYLKDANLPIGKYGLLRKSYLKEHKRGWYSSLLLTGKLDEHLAEIDHSCNERIELIMNQLARREGIYQWNIHNDYDCPITNSDQAEEVQVNPMVFMFTNGFHVYYSSKTYAWVLHPVLFERDFE